MLDDIDFPSCNEGEVPPGSDLLTCDFEKDTCAWYPDHFASLLWTRARRSQNDPSPDFDHTNGTGMCTLTLNLNHPPVFICLCVICGESLLFRLLHVYWN